MKTDTVWEKSNKSQKHVETRDITGEICGVQGKTEKEQDRTRETMGC